MNKQVYVMARLTGDGLVGRIGKLISLDGDMVTALFEENEIFAATTETIPASFLSFTSETEYNEQRARINKYIEARIARNSEFDKTFGFIFDK